MFPSGVTLVVHPGAGFVLLSGTVMARILCSCNCFITCVLSFTGEHVKLEGLAVNVRVAEKRPLFL